MRTSFDKSGSRERRALGALHDSLSDAHQQGAGAARTTPLASVRIIMLPGNPEGVRTLTFVQAPDACPFEIRRIYWLHDLRKKDLRGSHAHKALWQLLVAVTGAFDIAVSDGITTQAFWLDNPAQGLLLGPGLWRTIKVERRSSALVVLASAPFDEADYIRDHDEFLRFRGLKP